MGELDPDNPRKFNLDDVQLLTDQAIDYNVMAIRSDDTRFADIDSFIEYAKSNPVLVSAQATGITDGDSTTAEWFNKTFGTQITVVPVDGALPTAAECSCPVIRMYFSHRSPMS